MNTNDGLDQFQSESEASSEPAQAPPTVRLPLEIATHQAPPVPYVTRESRYGRALATAVVAFLLTLVVTGLLLRRLSGGEDSASAPPAEVQARQAPSEEEGSPPPAVRATTQPGGDAATGMAGVVPRPGGTVTPREPVKSAPAVRRRTPSRRVSRLARPLPRAAAPAPVVSAHMPVDNQRSSPTMTAREPAAPELGAEVSVTTSHADSDELSFRWSAPAGTFADRTASRTRFFCPATPQPVAVTVVVTDGKGATASDTFTVHCVASTR